MYSHLDLDQSAQSETLGLSGINCRHCTGLLAWWGMRLETGTRHSRDFDLKIGEISTCFTWKANG